MCLAPIMLPTRMLEDYATPTGIIYVSSPMFLNTVYAASSATERYEAINVNMSNAHHDHTPRDAHYKLR